MRKRDNHWYQKIFTLGVILSSLFLKDHCLADTLTLEELVTATGYEQTLSIAPTTICAADVTIYSNSPGVLRGIGVSPIAFKALTMKSTTVNVEGDLVGSLVVDSRLR